MPTRAELLAGRLLAPLTTRRPGGELRAARRASARRRSAQVGALQLTEPGYIDCLFRVSRPDVVGHSWTSSCGTASIWSSATTSGPVSTARTRRARFRAGVRLPADLLNELPYGRGVRLRVGATAGRADMVVAAEERLEFSAMNPHPERSVWNDWSWGRGGLLSPRLPWRIDAMVSPGPTIDDSRR